MFLTPKTSSLQAWRAVDRAYYDKTFNGQSWFRYRENALKKEKMSDREETYDAIRKMLQTLDDPFTRFLDPVKYEVRADRYAGPNMTPSPGSWTSGPGEVRGKG